MTTYSKHTDIQSVIEHAEKELEAIEVAYRAALTTQSIPAALLVDIKHYFGDMKSALDYIATKIPTRDGYFPVSNGPADFTNRTASLPAPAIAVLERWQPHKGNEWLAWFNTLNNKLKHVTLIPQERRETRETRVSGAGGGSVSWGSGVTFGSGVQVMGVPIDPRTQMPVPNSTVKTEVITWVDFVFDNAQVPSLPAGVSALPLLKTVMKNVPQIVKDLEAVI